MTYAEKTEELLKSAMADYNALYPDAPISALGDTPDRIFHLIDFDDWRSGEDPLTPDDIAQIEATSDGSFFS